MEDLDNHIQRHDVDKTEFILFKFALAAIVVAMILATLVGNALVCLAVLLVRKLRQPANLLLISLALADFFVGLIVMPLALVDLLADSWLLGAFACRIWTTADLTLCTASICNLCAISVDRYLAISRPLRYSALRTNARVAVYMFAVWAISFFVSVSSLLITHFLETEEMQANECQVTQNLGYQIYATLLAFYAPTFIMIILYIKIWRAAKRLAMQDKLLACNNRNSSTDSSNLLSASLPNGKNGSKSYFHRPSALLNAVKYHARQHEKTETKARQTLVFIICWLPFFILAILKPACNLDVPRWLDALALWLGYSNSMLNPAIYCKYNKEFRVPFREMLFCRFRTLQTVMRQQSFTSRYGPPTLRAPSINERVERPSSDL